MEKPGGHHLSQAIKVNTTVIRHRYHISPEMMRSGRLSITSIAFLPKAQKLNLIRRKHQTNPIERHCTE